MQFQLKEEGCGHGIIPEINQFWKYHGNSEVYFRIQPNGNISNVSDKWIYSLSLSTNLILATSISVLSGYVIEILDAAPLVLSRKKG